MKKTIKAELVSLAHKILQLRDTADYSKIAALSRELNDKLTILAYAEKRSRLGNATIGLKEVEDDFMTPVARETIENQGRQTVDVTTTSQEKTAISSKGVPIKTPAEILEQNQALYANAKATDDDHHRPDGTQYNTEAPVHEPVIEKIKDMWPEMTPEAEDLDKEIESIIPQTPSIGKNDSFEIGNEFAQIPIFEPKDAAADAIDERPKSLNDTLKKGTFKIGLNDKLSFIKHLFNGSAQDYNRVLSQLETFPSSSEAVAFIYQMIKPDYDNWEGKEVQEERFMELVTGRYR